MPNGPLVPAEYGAALHEYTILFYTTLYYTILHYTTLHYTTLYYTTLYYTILITILEYTGWAGIGRFL